jgi:hypothetical protein
MLYKILSIHGVGHAEEDHDWNQPWRDALNRAFGEQSAAQVSLQFDVLSYDNIFEQFPSNAAEDVEAIAELVSSAAWHAVTDPLQPRAFEPFDAFKYVGRWYAGMVAQWVVSEELRKRLRALLAEKIRDFQPDIVLAHSLGSLLSFDLFTNDDPGRKLLDGKIYITFGAQIANVFVRAKMWAGLVPMVSTGTWYHLYNKFDPAFTAPISEPGEPRFLSVETDSLAGHSATAVGGNPGYLDHPNTLLQVWQPISIGLRHKLVSRSFKIIAKATEPPRRRALLVGINEYPDPANRLEGCVNDVYSMSATLQENGFSPEDITVLINERATKENIIERLHWLLSNCDDQTDRVFYYSGHGLQIPGRGKDSAIDHLEDGIVPVDFDWQKLNAITDRDFLDLYSQLPKTSRFVAIFDSCFSGGMVKSRQAGLRSLPVPESLRHAFVRWDSKERRWINREFKKVLPGADGQQKLYAGQNGSTYKLLRAVPLRRLRKDEYDAVRKARNHEGPFLPVVMEACRDDQPSFEYPDGAMIRGAFTLGLTDVIKQAGSSGMNLTFKKLMEQIKKRLQDLGINQQPQLVGPEKVLNRPIAVWGSFEGDAAPGAARGMVSAEMAVGVAAIKGIDTSANTTGKGKEIKAKGYDAVGVYLRSDRCTGAMIKDLQQAGLKIWSTYEKGHPDHDGYFTKSQGATDGSAAAAFAAKIGQPHGTQIYATVDYDPSAPTINGPISEYMAAFQSEAKANGYLASVYGSGRTCRILIEKGLSATGWLCVSSSFAEHQQFKPRASIVQVTVINKDWDSDTIADISKPGLW